VKVERKTPEPEWELRTEHQEDTGQHRDNANNHEQFADLLHIASVA